ncbi:MAG: hypothetical protein CMA27_00525 [Euryarchaeota archaeon]|nr:hypothetical protein [Euryarchaeota archaeon]
MISYTEIQSGRAKENEINLLIIKQRRSIFMIIMLLGVTFATIQFGSWQAMASSDQDGDGLITSIEYLLNTQIQNWDSDGDGLPDGWEWKYGLNPLSASVGDDGQTGDPDGDQLTNLQEYNYGLPANWDNSNTPDVLDNGVWWNGTVPVNNWNEEDALQYNQPGCGDSGADGVGGVILCDEDPVGDICSDGFDNDHDGQIDAQDSDNDGDAVCGSNDDDGDGLIDEDPYGWDTDADGLSDGWEVANGLDPTDPTGNNGAQGDPDGDGMINIYEFINPSWDTQCNAADCFWPAPSHYAPSDVMTGTESPCNPVTGDGPNGCANLVAEVDGNTQTNPNNPDTDGDSISDGDEVMIWLTDPTEADTDGDGLTDGVEINSGYGNPAQATDPRNNNTDGDAWDDGDEDVNFNGQIDGNESDPTRREDTGDFDEDGIDNWEENLTCTDWNNADTDYGGVLDGDEVNPLHGTDPCDSLVDEVSTISSWGSATLTLSDASAFNPDGGKGWYQSTTGILTEFDYAARVGNQLNNVNVAPSGGDIVLAKDGSWCRMDAEADGTIFTSRQYCDDDYYDTDGDGLADWQERTAFFGYFSNHTNVDSDGDGQNDYDEVMGATDPLVACENSLDADNDGVNDYFETTIGCNLVYIGVLSGGNDVYVTDPLIFDTDNGGVSDYQEYFDGTNPEDDPSDDINPQDTDGDGIPDSIENLTGTDWRNPDTDGGGMSDYAECPPQFWSTLCNGSNYDPFDPTDDVTDENVVFWANTTSNLLDRDSTLYWRVNTYDNYTGGGYGIDASSHPTQLMSPNYLNTTWIADSAYSNGTISWNMAYNSPITSGLTVPMPHNWEALDIWADPTSKLERWDRVSTVTADGAPLFELTTQAKQLWYEEAEFDDSEPHVPSSLELNLPSYFSDGVSNESIVDTITQEVIADSGETSGFGMALALANYLRQGNETLFYQINFNGSGVDPSDDIVWHILNNSKEGTCSDFVTVFVTMARLAGIPARKVSGFVNGEQTADGYEVSSTNAGVWAEIHLRSVSNGADLGWIPIDPCPQPLEIELVNMTYIPDTWDRDGLTNITIEGDLVYSSNGTGIDGNTVRGYLAPVPQDPDASVATDSSMLVGTATVTNATGHFVITGVPVDAVMPGFQKIVVVNSAEEYIPPRIHEYPGHINVTDDSVIVHTSSTSIGQGATTDFSGTLSYENIPLLDVSEMANLTVQLDYVSQVSGPESLTTEVGKGGVWSFSLTLDPSEPLGPLQFNVSFFGWEDTDETYPGSPIHLRGSFILVNATVSLAPDVQGTVEGHEADNSRLLVGNYVYVNGTANSAGANPSPMDGLLELGIRANGSGLDYLVVFNQSVNGSFSLSYLLNASSISIPAGPIDVRLRFYPTTLDTTDDADLSEGYLLRSYLTFEIYATPQMRGSDANVAVTAKDHRGISTDLNLTGTFNHFFDSALVNTSVDPTSNPIPVNWATLNSMLPGDYVFETNFGGSELFDASSSQEFIRIQGNAELQVSLSSNWIHIGDIGYLTGQLIDEDKSPAGPITGNGTEIILQILDQDQLKDTIIGNGSVDVNTGEFNISFIIPPGLSAGAYVFSVIPTGLIEPEYYIMPNAINVTVGLESEFKLEVVDSEGEPVNGANVLNAPLSGDLEFGVFAIDVGNNSRFSDRTIHAVFDWNGSQQALPDEVTQTWNIPDGRGGFTIEAGSANFTWTIPGGTAPGTYILRIYIDDDVSDLISDIDPARWIGNETFVDVTIQVPSAVVIDWIQPEVTAGAFFSVSGHVEDGDDNTRVFNGPISLKVYFLTDEDEQLITTYVTNATGWFNISSPTDSSLDGVSSGDRIVVVEVVNGSNIYYLPSSEQASIHVTGVSAFVELNHSSPIIINRGETLEVFSKLVETSATCSACAFDTPIDVRQKNKPVYFLFDETWLPGQVTNSTGEVGFTHQIPFDQPLGTVVLTLYYNGSNDVHPTTRNLPSTIIRSVTILVMDPILENPMAGGSFNLSGTIESDNGTSLMNRNGVSLLAQVQITMDGQSIQYLDGQINANGTWYANVYVEPTTPAGTHEIRVAYNPQVPFYINSSVFDTIDIRGYAVIDFLEPGNLQNADSKDRGTSVDVVVRVFDNAGQPVPNAMVDIELLTTSESGTLITNASGLGEVTITIPQDVNPGIFTLFASWAGNVQTIGSTGIEGGNSSVKFVVLAHTELTLDSVEGSMVVGENIWVNGTLLDDVGNPLLGADGLAAGGLVRLYVDNLPIATSTSDGNTGFYSIEYELPEWMSAGPHIMRVEFSGGFLWIAPYANGDSVNPEYYWNSSYPSPDQEFNVFVPTDVVVLTPQGSQVDRGSDLIINGTLVDIQNRELDGRTLQIFVGINDGTPDYFVTTNEYGIFTISLRVPDDQLLGELDITIRFDGDDFNLSSESISKWYVYATTSVSVEELSPQTLGDNVTITGLVVDNLDDSLDQHQLRITLDGVEIGIINSSSDGSWTYEWIIPPGTNWGEHTIGVRAPNQGYYRESYAETSLFVAHRSSLEYSLEQDTVVRGESWNLSGILYDADDLSKIGLGNETLTVYLDGVLQPQSIQTESDGSWTYYLPVDMSLDRGKHTILVEFAGTITHVGSSQEVEVTAWSEVQIQFTDLSSEYVVRGSDEFPIEIYGEISEVGGNNLKFSNLSLSLMTEDGTLISSQLNWTVIGTQLFYISAIAPTTLSPGNLVLVVEFSGSEEEYLVSTSKNLSMLLKVDATFEMDLETIILGEREDIYGNITVTADDTSQPLEGISVILTLGNETGDLVTRTLITNEFGIAEINLENTPPYSDVTSFGTVELELKSDDSRISNKSLVTLQAQVSNPLIYQSVEVESGPSAFVWTSLIALVVLAGVGIMWYRKRKQDVLDEIASIFSYTAELLAHGDEIRESVFHCYEDLCRVLTKHGYLRRDFETVREFEMALRSALPIRENFLIELDNVFEEARYSRHEMNTQDALRAQSALEGVQSELVRMNVGKGGREDQAPEIEA